jgi:Anaerobic dehydrogenases, typically selenocysteine-containing
MRNPGRRVGDEWQPLGWNDAFDLVAERFAAIQREHGANALGIYLGNPTVHHAGSILNGPALIRALRTRNRFSATSVDQMPQHVACHAMYGHMFMFPIPDVDHTHYWLILGANPIASSGSIMTVPDVAKRLKAVRDRGGQVVVIDPCRTDTAEAASRHHFIRPGTDAAFLLALINAVLDLGPPNIARYAGRLSGSSARSRRSGLSASSAPPRPPEFTPRRSGSSRRNFAPPAAPWRTAAWAWALSRSAPCASGSSNC